MLRFHVQTCDLCLGLHDLGEFHADMHAKACDFEMFSYGDPRGLHAFACDFYILDVILGARGYLSQAECMPLRGIALVLARISSQLRCFAPQLLQRADAASQHLRARNWPSANCSRMHPSAASQHSDAIAQHCFAMLR